MRREIGDTNEAAQLLSDEEIQQAITDQVSVLLAAARCCDWIARVFALDFDFEADGTRVAKIQRAKQYRELATELRGRGEAEASGTGGIGVVHTRNVDGYQPGSNPTIDHHDVVSVDAW